MKKAKVKDWTKLESYAGLSLEEASATIKSCGHMLAFGNDAWAIEVIKTFQDCEPEAGMAALTAATFINRHGPSKTATTGVKLYREIATETGKQDLAQRVLNLEFMVFFADHGGTTQKLEWPIPWTLNEPPKKAGLANIMLHMAAMKFAEPGCSTSEQVAAFGIQRFFDDGMSKIKKASRSSRMQA